MKNVTIVGVGALGSHAALFLRNEVILKVIDFDRVERKNVLSQFHGTPGVGKNKVQSLQQSFQFFFGLKVAGIPHRLTEDNYMQLLSGSDLIIDCLDNAVARRLVQSFARKLGTPCLHGALAANGAYGRVVWDENFSIDSEGAGGGATCEDGEHLPFIAMVSSLLARSAQEFLAKSRKLSFEVYPGGVIKA